MKQPCLSQTCTWSSPVCTVLCSFHSGRHRSRPSGRACVNESACSSVSQNHSVTGFPLHSTNVMSETSGQIQTQRLQQCVEGQLTFNDSPGIQSSSDPLPSSLDHRVAANHGKWSAFLRRNTNRDGCFYFNPCPTWESWERVCFKGFVFSDKVFVFLRDQQFEDNVCCFIEPSWCRTNTLSHRNHLNTCMRFGNCIFFFLPRTKAVRNAAQGKHPMINNRHTGAACCGFFILVLAQHTTALPGLGFEQQSCHFKANPLTTEAQPFDFASQGVNRKMIFKYPDHSTN